MAILRMIMVSALISPVLALTSWVAVADPHILLGESAKIGNGTVQTFMDMLADGTPRAIGITFDEGLLDNLPAAPNTTGRCFDIDGDGAFGADECEGDYEVRIDMPEEVRSRPDLTFEWVGLNWNPLGHVPPGVYDLPHFDMHFYTVNRESIDGVRLGPCETLVNCGDRERALKPVPAQFLPLDYTDARVVVGQMGNHLLDFNSPELRDPPETFTHTFIYGANDGSIIFLEPMITRAFLLDGPEICVPLKLSQAYEEKAFFPTEYCMRHLGEENRYTV